MELFPQTHVQQLRETLTKQKLERCEMTIPHIHHTMTNTKNTKGVGTYEKVRQEPMLRL